MGSPVRKFDAGDLLGADQHGATLDQARRTDGALATSPVFVPEAFATCANEIET
ncbi:MAG TPA: hypothetical protein PK156_45265 [Polyangium sp.]|nr:hypothetical protein [Polyangium sp.]